MALVAAQGGGGGGGAASIFVLEHKLTLLAMSQPKYKHKRYIWFSQYSFLYNNKWFEFDFKILN